MNNKSITFLLPCVSTKPYGGCKIALDYCNALSRDGYDVHIVYPCSLLFKQRSLIVKLKCIPRWFKYWRRFTCRVWYPLEEKIVEHFVPSLNYKWIPKTEKYVATSVETAFYLKDYNLEKYRCFYFVQGFETWHCDEETVRKTYHFPFNKIVISKWLEDIIVSEEKEKCQVVPNGFDPEIFQLIIPAEEKNKYEVSMMDHVNPSKDIETGIKALYLVKEKIPELTVNLFSIYPPSKEYPEWFNFYSNPTISQHIEINNKSAIYLGSSKTEGWGLTIGEAMMCGQAVVCTNNKGYLEMAEDGYNALVANIGDYEMLAAYIVKLIEDDQLRYSISNNAYKSIQSFNNIASENEFVKIINKTN